jgi:hypothetical protein
MRMFLEACKISPMMPMTIAVWHHHIEMLRHVDDIDTLVLDTLNSP